MSRTKRGVQYDKYWAYTLKECTTERHKQLFGTDTANYTCNSGKYYNVAHRKGRRIERDNLRPHLIRDAEWFDDSDYLRKYKSIWWDIL